MKRIRIHPRWSRGALVVGLLGIVAYSSALAQAQRARAHPFFTRLQRRPLVIAHRGGAGLWPEQTLYTFEQAIALDVDALEMDVHQTADGVLVLMHDNTVDRTTNGHGSIKYMTLAEIKQLDAGYTWTTDDGQTFPFRNQGITVPTLAEVFTMFPQTPMIIEIKPSDPSIVKPFCQMIHDFDRTHLVQVGSIQASVLKAFRRECPAIATSSTIDEVALLWWLHLSRLSATCSPVFEALQIPEYAMGTQLIVPHFIRAAHRRGLEVHVWTINETDDMRRLLDLGVDGIITDYPDRLLKLTGRLP
ncbi:MAG: glycerophosphodiester phosphodiesterase [Chloroflexaceae bacterium]|nr:glycerophosphodiester phosphodiesterase [Chloroflexaceae bacterium]